MKRFIRSLRSPCMSLLPHRLHPLRSCPDLASLPSITDPCLAALARPVYLADFRRGGTAASPARGSRYALSRRRPHAVGRPAAKRRRTGLHVVRRPPPIVFNFFTSGRANHRRPHASRESVHPGQVLLPVRDPVCWTPSMLDAGAGRLPPPRGARWRTGKAPGRGGGWPATRELGQREDEEGRLVAGLRDGAGRRRRG